MRNGKKRIPKRVIQVVFSSLVAVIIVGVLVYVTAGRNIPVLDTHGVIANQERNLIYLTVGLGAIVVVPVFIMLFSIAWRYRASNTKATYQPEFSGHRGIEALWWGIPCVIIIILAVITVIYTHALDPYKPIDSSVKPIKIQVIALEWKWLFVYPDQGVATLNFMNIPKDTPIDFTITSDAPMNSFWIPALAGQVYAMPGMSTQLHLMADSVGSYTGSSANISGAGFADMQFKVNAMNQPNYQAWVKKAAMSSNMLTSDAYKKLAMASRGDPDTTYMLMDSSLYNEVIMKYMTPGGDMNMSGMGH